MLDALDVLVETAAAAMGTPLVLRRDLSWPHRESSVAEVRDAAGTAWIVKQERDPAVFAREVRALRDWAPRVGEGMAPRLRATVASRSVLVMDRLPGRAGVAATAAEFRQAGALIRRLHEAEPASADAGYAARATDNVNRWVREVPGVVGAAELDFVHARLPLLASLPAGRNCPVHNDNQPRNWLTGPDGTVRLIDFGRAKRDYQLRDFERMQYREWPGRPDLREAFFDGYGRTLTDDEEQALSCMGAAGAVTTVLWARAHGDPGYEQDGRRTLELLRGAGRT